MNINQYKLQLAGKNKKDLIKICLKLLKENYAKK